MRNIYFCLFFIITAVFMIFSCSTINVTNKQPYQYTNQASRSYTRLPRDNERMYFHEYGKGFLIFDFRRPKILMLQNSEIPYTSCSVTYRAYRSYNESREEYNINKIRIDGVLTNISRENLPNIEIDGKIIRRLKVIVGENEYYFDRNVEEIPISLGITYDEIIHILGQPDNEVKGIYDTWRIGTSSLATAFYRPDLNNRYHSNWILQYNIYPGYAFKFNDDGILISFDIY